MVELKIIKGIVQEEDIVTFDAKNINVASFQRDAHSH